MSSIETSRRTMEDRELLFKAQRSLVVLAEPLRKRARYLHLFVNPEGANPADQIKKAEADALSLFADRLLLAEYAAALADIRKRPRGIKPLANLVAIPINYFSEIKASIRDPKKDLVRRTGSPDSPYRERVLTPTKVEDIWMSETSTKDVSGSVTTLVVATPSQVHIQQWPGW